MRFPIDVVFIDPEQIVLRIEPELRSFKTASCRGAREVVELAAGECARRGLEAGDRVAWASRTTADDDASVESAAISGANRTSVIVASDDKRFTKLAAFLLDGRGIDVAADVAPDELRDAVDDEHVDGVILDAGDGLAEALRVSNSTRAHRPALPIVIVGDQAVAERAPGTAPVFDKWEQLDDAIDALEVSIGDAHA
jgi:PleD family two-component response regulator